MLVHARIKDSHDFQIFFFDADFGNIILLAALWKIDQPIAFDTFGTATTRLISHHISKGETIAQSLKDRLDYGKDPDKTQGGELISAYECDHMTADAEFLLAKVKYKTATGREQRREADVLCYQIRQSFKPGEITPEEANKVGYETAMRWTKGKYAFFVATHTDRQHIHNVRPDRAMRKAVEGTAP